MKTLLKINIIAASIIALCAGCFTPQPYHVVKYGKNDTARFTGCKRVGDINFRQQDLLVGHSVAMATDQTLEKAFAMKATHVNFLEMREHPTGIYVTAEAYACEKDVGGLSRLNPGQ